MARSARAAGFEVRAVADPRVPAQEWLAAARADGQVPVLLSAADAVMMRAFAVSGALNHAPAALVWCNGVMNPEPVLGVMTDRAWVAVLNHRVRQLTPCQS